MPIMKAESDGRDFNALTTYGWNNHSIRTKEYRYIQYEDQTEELYHKSSDPNEFVNLAGNPDYKSTKDKLKQLLPVANEPWHQHSTYNFQPYFVEQKERLNAAPDEKDAMKVQVLMLIGFGDLGMRITGINHSIPNR